MRSLQNIDAQVVGSICADSSTYCSISDVFKMNNLVSDIRSILSGKKTYVGRLHGDNSKNIEIKFHKTEVSLIGVASCCGEKAYQMLPIKEMEAMAIRVTFHLSINLLISCVIFKTISPISIN